MIADPVFSEMLWDPDQSHSHDHTTQETSSHSHSHSHSQSHSHSRSHDPNPSFSSSSSSSTDRKPSQQGIDLAQDKVRSTLRSFVRDWSVEGALEREKCYNPCLEALERHYEGKGKKREEVEVLVPGCGLGRLAMEIAARGQSKLSYFRDILADCR